MKTIRVFAVLTAALVVTTAAVAGEGGSLYSMFGIGDLRPLTSVRNAGMGSAGSSLVSTQYINLGAPATWSRLMNTRLEASAGYEGFSSTDGTTSRTLSTITFGGAMIGFPISQANGITFVLGVAPLSTVNYDTYVHGTAMGGTDTIAYDTRYTGRGGIGVGKLGFSYAPFSFLSLGTSLDYYFGTIDHEQTINPVSTTYGGSRVTTSRNYRGSGVTLGLLVPSLGWASSALAPLSAGITVSSRAALTAARTTYFEYGARILDNVEEFDTTAEFTGDQVIPLSYTFGLAYTTDRYLLAADYNLQRWKESAVDGATPANIRNARRFGIGVERIPSRDPNASWGERTALRLGFSWQQLYYSPRGFGINEWLVTAGASLPMGYDARLHLSAEFGMRGSTDNGLVRDRIIRVNAAVTVGELWFMRSDEE